ncbi:MAG: hypothetical protein QF473_13565 [Planctomycetota bacterium]|jgi:hypothetical protein|nr:hypothetical protein [Planctomycetota bacterium]MDP6503100.1 hypothetical protein [Planctomycetota bacterium]
MAEKKYGLMGWKLPVLNRDDPEYCESGCPVCRSARKGNPLAKALQAIEMKVTRGGCPWGKAREKKYGVKPDEPIPPDSSER